MKLTPPQPLAAEHTTAGFASGEAELDGWLQRRALANLMSGASRTFVVLDGLGQVRGYYALAAGAVSHRLATGAVRRNMPEPVPALVLGRLAVDAQAQGQGLGAALLQDALHRALAVAQHAGVRALLVHALHERARNFYLRYGFAPSPIDPMTLMLRLNWAAHDPGTPPP